MARSDQINLIKNGLDLARILFQSGLITYNLNWEHGSKEPFENINININITLTFIFWKKLEYKTVQLHVYIEIYIYAWWIIYTSKKAYLTWKVNLNNNWESNKN